MNDLKVKHASGAYKYLPGYPDYSDILFILGNTKKSVITMDELVKLSGCDRTKLIDPLVSAVEQGNVEKIADDKYNILNTKFREIVHTD